MLRVIPPVLLAASFQLRSFGISHVFIATQILFEYMHFLKSSTNESVLQCKLK